MVQWGRLTDANDPAAFAPPINVECNEPGACTCVRVRARARACACNVCAYVCVRVGGAGVSICGPVCGGVWRGY